MCTEEPVLLSSSKPLYAGVERAEQTQNPQPLSRLEAGNMAAPRAPEQDEAAATTGWPREMSLSPPFPLAIERTVRVCGPAQATSLGAFQLLKSRIFHGPGSSSCRTEPQHTHHPFLLPLYRSLLRGCAHDSHPEATVHPRRHF